MPVCIITGEEYPMHKYDITRQCAMKKLFRLAAALLLVRIERLANYVACYIWISIPSFSRYLAFLGQRVTRLIVHFHRLIKDCWTKHLPQCLKKQLNYVRKSGTNFSKVSFFKQPIFIALLTRNILCEWLISHLLKRLTKKDRHMQ